MTALLLLALLGDASAASKKQLRAENERLALEAAATQAALAEARAELDGLRASLAEATESVALRDERDRERATSLEGLLAEVDALTRALEAPPKKGTKPDPRLPALKEDLVRLGAGIAGLRASYALPTATDEQAAAELANQLREALGREDQEGARLLGEQLRSRYPQTRAARSSERSLNELAVLGIRPAEPGVLQWFGEPWRLADHRVNVVVFWEVWCPHCKRSLPELELHWQRWRDQGVGVVGLTRLTKTASAEGVRAFLADERISFPNGQEDGEYAKLFAVTGVPAAAVIRDGVVVWRGHPAKLTDEIVLGRAP